MEENVKRKWYVEKWEELREQRGVKEDTPSVKLKVQQKVKQSAQDDFYDWLNSRVVKKVWLNQIIKAEKQRWKWWAADQGN